MVLPALLLSPESYTCRLDWGLSGVRRAVARQDVVVIVDVLRFSTATIVAVHHGAIIYPCAPTDAPEVLARRLGADLAAYQRDMLATHRYSLSPVSYEDVPQGMRIVLPSPNGAACSRIGRGAPYLFVGALVNAAAVGAVVAGLVTSADLEVTVIACGERWPSPTEDGALRVAVEDYLGAGAILSYLPFSKSPEARVCEAAFSGLRDQLRDLLWESSSGRELRQKSLGADVELAARLNHYATVPIMRGEQLERFQP